eukprot:1226687-Pyramimonas_sp.AAC.1
MGPRTQGSARRSRVDFLSRLASPLPRQQRLPLEKLEKPTGPSESRPQWASGGGRDSLSQVYKENKENPKRKKSQGEKAQGESAKTELEAKETAEVAEMMERMLNTVGQLLAVAECDGMQEQLEEYQVRNRRVTLKMRL